MNNDRRAKLKQYADEIQAGRKATIAEMKAESKAFHALPDGLKTKRATHTWEKLDSLYRRAECCAGDAIKLLRRSAK